MDTAASALSILRDHSLSTLIEREIEALILAGELAVGERVNEIKLAQRFRVSRGPIREALRALEGLGLVELVPNRGIFIRRLELSQALDVYGVRAVLFGYAGRLLALRATAEDDAALAASLAAMETAARERDYERYIPLNFAFHEMIVDRAGNPVLATQYRGLVKQLRLYRAHNLMMGDTLARSNAEHAAIVAAVTARDPEAAAAACHGHVDRGRERLAARAARDSDGAADFAPNSDSNAESA